MSIILMLLMFQTGEAAPKTDQVLINFNRDRNIEFQAKGRAGNLNLRSSAEDGSGKAVLDYQQGSGFIRYNRESQELFWRTRTKFMFNRIAKNVMKVAPTLDLTLPKHAEVDFKVKVNSMGLGTLNFRDLDIYSFDLDVEFGDVDITFPTENKSIVREWANFELRAGDLEIYDLGNLKAHKVKINGGMGELTVDFGPRIFVNTEVRLDHDIGTMEIIVPKGTRLRLRGTSRNFDKLGFTKQEGYWEISSYHHESPILEIKLTGPVGDLSLVWK